jgi:LysM domain
VCPFLRFADGDALAIPLETPDAGNRCVAIGAPSPQSLRQQELVCLRAAHVDCPRYLRGGGASAATPRQRAKLPRATVAALLILVLSAGISFGFVVQRGGIDLPATAGPSATSAAVLPPTASPASALPSSDAATSAPTASESASLAPSPSVSPSATPEPTPTPTPEPTATPTPEPTATPIPTSDRYQLLVACPNRRNCYIYTVRSGDNLYSIAHYFGIPLSTIYDWNPTYANGGRLRPGAEIKMPPPTR